MATKNDKLKAKKDKATAKKDKMKDKLAAKKAKCKGGKCHYPALIIGALSLALVAGCSSAQPASRATSASYGDIEVRIADKASHNTVRVTIGDGAFQAADSSGSTETQTATPTLSIPVRIDARYNDMLAQASDATRSTLSTIGGGLGAVLDMMMSGKSGKVDVTKSDGTAATVQCENGQCSFCEECTTK